MKIIIFLTLLMTGCTQEPLPTPCANPPCDSTTVKKDSILTLIWQIALRNDGEYTTMDAHTIAGDFIVISYDNTEQGKLLFVNKDDTSSARFHGPNKGDYKNLFYHPVVGMIAIDYQSVFTGHDAASMKKIASAQNGLQFFANYNLIGDFVYGDLRDDGQRINYLFRLNVITGEMSNIQTIPDSNFPEYKEVSLSIPSFFVAGQNDTLMRYGYLFWKNHFEADRSVEMYNKKSGELLWKFDNKKLNVTQRRTVRYNGNLISFNTDSIYCLDPYTGRTIWSIPPIRSTIPIGWSLGNVSTLR